MPKIFGTRTRKIRRTTRIKQRKIRGGCQSCGVGFVGGGGDTKKGGCSCDNPLFGGNKSKKGGSNILEYVNNIIPYNLNQHQFPEGSRNNFIGGGREKPNENTRMHFSKLKKMALKKRRTGTSRKHKVKGGFDGVSSFGGINMLQGYYNLLSNNVPIVPPIGSPQQYV
jgi:hypothetical protein